MIFKVEDRECLCSQLIKQLWSGKALNISKGKTSLVQALTEKYKSISLQIKGTHFTLTLEIWYLHLAWRPLAILPPVTGLHWARLGLVQQHWAWPSIALKGLGHCSSSDHFSFKTEQAIQLVWHVGRTSTSFLGRRDHRGLRWPRNLQGFLIMIRLKARETAYSTSLSD